MEPLLVLKDITKTFPGVIALSNMNFELYPGEIHAICGENGAGKSTLMKVVTGVYKPEMGEIILNGEKQEFSSPNDSFAKGIAIIYQETSLFEEMTVLENLFLGHEKTKKVFGFLPVIDYGSMYNEVDKIFKQLNTNIDAGRKIKEFGMATKQMVEIAKALTFNSKILILDEPTASLTQREVDALFAIIRKLKSQGVGIAYISHRLEEIFELCDRVTVIRDGKYISTKKVSETDKNTLVADMVGRSVDNYYPKIETEIRDEQLFRVENLSSDDLLCNISFEIKKGEIVGFAGLAGSGRTELAQAICGLMRKTDGELYLENKKIQIDSYRDSLDHGIVYVSEDRAKYGLVVDMSVKHNITMPQLKNLSKLSFISGKKEKQISEKYIRDVGIKAPDSDFLVTNLSGGNQQKVSVSKALAMNPKLLILDEPTRGVDVNAKAEIYRIISELLDKGLTIFLISSELSELLGMCDRIYVMKNGHIAGCFNRADATQEKILKVALEIKE